MIKLRARVLDEMKGHAEREYPQECCGLLIGRIEDAGRTRVILETYPAANAWEDAGAIEHRRQVAPGDEGKTSHRMLIAPDDYRRAELAAVKMGLGVVGDYHSHPDHPAVPSQFDLEHSPWPTMSYIIVSVNKGQASDLRSWELEADHSMFTEEEMMLVQE
ncbi:MAG TPA: M67 family metallopeptidase [Pyrinomonadaceae bacterium]|jgi:proteasome lid subunit RPN8/RPN11|nr:M67 family metallopeptidase [Pyrinomonadaceae bacterium]